MSRQGLDFRRGIQAYRAGVTYGISSMADRAFDYIQVFDKDLDIRRIILLVRGNVSDLVKRDRLTAYLERRMAEAFKQNADIFNDPNFVKAFGKDANLDPSLWKAVVSILNDRISELWTCNLLKDKVLEINPPVPAPIPEYGTGDNHSLDEASGETIDEDEEGVHLLTPGPPCNQDTFCENGTELGHFKQEESERLRAQTQSFHIAVNMPVETPSFVQNGSANKSQIEAIHHPFFPPSFISCPADFSSSSLSKYTPISSSGKTTQTSSSDACTRRSDEAYPPSVHRTHVPGCLEAERASRRRF
ncbi:hypothetical protein BDW69DRAFT_38578 [Aspergillus filifer]